MRRQLGPNYDLFPILVRLSISLLFCFQGKLICLLVLIFIRWIVLGHYVHVIDVTSGSVFMIASSWLQQTIEGSGSTGGDTEDLSLNEFGEVDETSSALLSSPSYCIPIYIPSEADKAAALAEEYSQERKSTDNSANGIRLIAYSVLYDAFLGHVALFQLASGRCGAINLTVHLKLCELQQKEQVRMVVTYLRCDNNEYDFGLIGS